MLVYYCLRTVNVCEAVAAAAAAADGADDGGSANWNKIINEYYVKMWEKALRISREDGRTKNKT